MIKKELPDGIIGQFLRGLGYPVRGFSFIRENKLWGPCIWPILIDFLTLAGLIVLTVLYADNLRDLIWDKPVGEGIWHGTKVVLWHALHVLLLLLMIILDALLFVLVGTIIAGPFLDALSERTERIVGVTEIPEFGFFKSLLYSLKDLVFILAFYLAVSIPLLFVNFIPFVGSVAYAILSTIFAWLMLSLDFLSLPFNRRLMPFKDKWKIVWVNKWLSLGFGCATFVLLFVPFLNLLLLPLAGVGGTLFFTELSASGRLSR